MATYLAKLTLNNVVAVDINEAACALTMRTAAANGARVDVIRGDLCGALRSRSVDALVFIDRTEALQPIDVTLEWAKGRGAADRAAAEKRPVKLAELD